MAPAAGMWMVHFNPPHSKILAEVNGLIVGHNSVCLLIKEGGGGGGAGGGGGRKGGGGERGDKTK